jgi:starch-binding outer membrane protein, SusD/RagB family
MRPIQFRRAVWTLLGIAPVVFAGCQNSVTDSLLSADQPGIIDPSNVNSSAGADAIRLGTLISLRGITTAWTLGGLVGDEWDITGAASITGFVDQRRGSNPFAISAFTSVLRAVASVRTSANQAIPLLDKWSPTPLANIAEMYFARGYAELQTAADFCNGIPLDDGNTSPPVYTMPLTNAQIYDIAAASFDTAMSKSTGTDAASVNINRAARIGKARALVGNAKFAEAAALVSSALVPTTYTYNFTYATTSGNNPIWTQNASGRSYSLGDSVEGNSHNIIVPGVIPYFSAHDPRLPAAYTVSANGKDTTKGTDGLTLFRGTTLYGQTTPIALVNGIDARLVEAEAKLQANDIAGMITILNAVRATTLTIGTVTVTAAQLPPLAPPATKDAAVNLLFRERAFWTFARGQRLGEMRRLIRQYGRTQDKVFPTGPYPSGGSTYGTDVNFPLGQDENGNPNFKGCIDLNA